RLLMALQEGDSILVERMFSLADTTRHLMELLKLCGKDGVTIHFMQEGIQSKRTLDFELVDLLERLLTFQSDIVKQSTILGLA
ncbi:recombinase family protein, partial [Escherichia coli]|uniref:recombinase family protein n=1 Tax=Escherichia coli TaxID=562 RepID=UPI003BA1FE18